MGYMLVKDWMFLPLEYTKLDWEVEEHFISSTRSTIPNSTIGFTVMFGVYPTGLVVLLSLTERFPYL